MSSQNEHPTTGTTPGEHSPAVFLGRSDQDPLHTCARAKGLSSRALGAFTAQAMGHLPTGHEPVTPVFCCTANSMDSREDDHYFVDFIQISVITVHTYLILLHLPGYKFLKREERSPTAFYAQCSLQNKSYKSCAFHYDNEGVYHQFHAHLKSGEGREPPPTGFPPH